MKNISYYIKRLCEEKQPLRFILSRLLCGLYPLSYFIVIDRGSYKIRFFPTALSTSLWYQPADRLEEEVLLESILECGSVFIDVGANIGTHSLAAASLVGARGRIVAFEASPRTCKFLRKNIELNGFENIEVINSAVGDRDGNLLFSDFTQDDVNRPSIDGGGNEVEIVRLDSIIDEKNIRLLKIDVEGFEPAVFQGGLNTLAIVEVVIFEANPTRMQDYGFAFEHLRSLLLGKGFLLYRGSGDKFLKIEDNYTPEEGEDMLAVREDFFKALSSKLDFI